MGATGALVQKHQAISIHSADQMPYALNQCQNSIYSIDGKSNWIKKRLSYLCVKMRLVDSCLRVHNCS